MLLKVIDIEDALSTMEKHFPGNVLEKEYVSLLDAAGRVAAEDIKAVVDVPGFDKAVVDGYAVIAKDTFGAGDSLPALLHSVGEVMIGRDTEIMLRESQCAYVPTGGMLPAGSDAVVMVEDTEDLGSGTVAIYRPVGPWNNTIRRGEDIASGRRVLKDKTVIKPHHIGSMASVGLKKIAVRKRPRVFIISTGDELIPPGEALGPGNIWDVNSYSLATAVAMDGGVPIIGGIVGDDWDAIKERVIKGLTKCDVMLISGGSSAGNRDYTAGIIDKLGKPGVLAHGISIKPGKPTIIGGIDGKPVIGMPGQPVSSLVVYDVIVSPLIRRLAGLEAKERILYNAVCDENYYSAPGREEYLMVTVYRGKDGKIRVRPVSGKSGMITTISDANGMVVIPKNKEGLYKDEEVPVTML